MSHHHAIRDPHAIEKGGNMASSTSSRNGSSSMMNGRNGNDVSNGTSSTLDHNLYSRQIYALGESAMMNLRAASVLISGVGSVGVEIAKNLILGGVRHITIQDTRTTTWHDLSAQYYLNEADIGVNRAVASFERLAELNDSVNVQLLTEPLNAELIAQFDLIVLTSASLDEQLRVNAWTRAAGRRFIATDARGLFSFIFVDLGAQFRVDDANGEQCHEVLIEHIDALSGDVTTLENALHGFEDGDHVTFSEVKGMTELNGIKPIPITVKKPHVFNIGSHASTFHAYAEGGRARQVKVPRTIDFLPLAETLTMENPPVVMWDFAKFEYPQQLHVLWQALHAFEAKEGRSPAPRCETDVSLLKSLIPSGISVDEKLLRAFSFQARGNLAPIASVIGGLAAQEAMKAVTHHMMPVRQFVYADSIESLPAGYSQFDAETLTQEDCAPRNSRYDGQAAVFGWRFQEALSQQRWFIVGAGAIGCELLKNLAMMGVATGPTGLVQITDMDQIEISNLNRQFLFRRNDVGKKKSEVAASAVVAHFNPHLHMQALSDRVGPDTEHIFTDDFFAKLTGVLNALDNVDARRYMDRRCVYYRLPLLESGTMGSKGNTQVVYPYLTESYGSSQDPPEKDIPICTLKNFPNEIQHTIQWARELFEGFFSNPAETANQFLADQRAFLDRIETMNTGQRLQMLEMVKRALIDERPDTPDDCIKWARLAFEEHFHNTIAQLLHTFPPGQCTQHGVKFWSGTKRCPHVLAFDPGQEEHFNFVYAASILRAQQYGLTPIVDRARVVELATAVRPKPFEPRTGIRIAVTDEEAKQQMEENVDMNDDTDAMLNKYKMALARLNKKTMTPLVAIDFEKDDDSNHHMEFITAASNLRAENYEIPPADRMKTKQIAGRIIPAIATTTATTAGLVCLELYKMVASDGRIAKVPIERFKNGFLNLALPYFGFAEPIAAPKKECNGRAFTLWDRLEIQGPKTLKEVIDWIQEECKVEVTMLSSGVALIYSFFMAADKRNERLAMNMKDVVEHVARKAIPAHCRSLTLDVMTTDAEGEDVETPYVKYNF